jgi:hypothetical protein
MHPVHSPTHRHAAGSQMRPSVESMAGTRASAPADDAAGADTAVPGWLRCCSAALLAAGTCQAVYTLAVYRTLDCYVMTLVHGLALYSYALRSTRTNMMMFAVCTVAVAACCCFELGWTRLSKGVFELTPKPSVDIMRLPGKALGFFMFMTAYQVRWTRWPCHAGHAMLCVTSWLGALPPSPTHTCRPRPIAHGACRLG